MRAGAMKAGSRPPWLGLSAAVWVQVAGGASSTFALYSHALKVALGIDQSRLAMLAVACDVGDNLGLLPGVLCNRFHPGVLLLIGAAACVLGYGTTWLAVSGIAPALPYWLIWLALCLAANSGAWLGTAVLVTNMRNFPLSRGAVAGILKGYVGLSAAVYTEIYTGVLHDSAAGQPAILRRRQSLLDGGSVSAPSGLAGSLHSAIGTVLKVRPVACRSGIPALYILAAAPTGKGRAGPMKKDHELIVICDVDIGTLVLGHRHPGSSPNQDQIGCLKETAPVRPSAASPVQHIPRPRHPDELIRQYRHQTLATRQFLFSAQRLPYQIQPSVGVKAEISESVASRCLLA